MAATQKIWSWPPKMFWASREDVPGVGGSPAPRLPRFVRIQTSSISTSTEYSPRQELAICTNLPPCGDGLACRGCID